MQIDIACFELLVHRDIKNEMLPKFRILIIEFHGTRNLLNREHFANTFKPVFDSLTSHFEPVHKLGNNWYGVPRYEDFTFSEVFQITLHRKDRSRIRNCYRKLPKNLDFENVAQKEALSVLWP